MSQGIPRLTAQHALAQLGPEREFVTLFEHGSLEVEIYKPNTIDRQKPHSRDELYVVIAGHGIFFCGGERRPFESGETLFVPAGVEHRFENFSDGFSTWVFFYGPEGGEAQRDQDAK